MVVDGTFTTSGKFKHTILLATNKDPNNNLILYAIGIVDIENKENWCWFLLHLIQDFNGMRACVSDFQKGIESDEFQTLLILNSIKFGQCFKHLKENCGKAIKKKISKDANKYMVRMSKARTKDTYDYLKTILDQENEEASLWLEGGKESLLSTPFLIKDALGMVK